jgi:hypothetical protein
LPNNNESATGIFLPNISELNTGYTRTNLANGEVLFIKMAKKKKVKNPNHLGPGYRRTPHLFTFTPCALSCLFTLSLCDGCVGYRRRRRPTTGAEALAGLFAGDENPPEVFLPLLLLSCYAKPSTQTLN